LHRLRAANYGLRYSAFMGAMAQGLAAIGELDEAAETVEAALDWAKANGELWYLPELLRIKGWLLHLQNLPASTRAAERLLQQAIELSRGQNALTWELKAASDLARLWQSQGQAARARRLLQPIYDRFEEGFDTAHLRAARALLLDLAASPPGHRRPDRASLAVGYTPGRSAA
jgi:predicted ATPase